MSRLLEGEGEEEYFPATSQVTGADISKEEYEVVSVALGKQCGRQRANLGQHLFAHLRCAMHSRMPLFVVSLFLFASVHCDAQTATCTNWKFFQAPSPWTGSAARGINRWGTIVGSAGQSNSANWFGFVRYSNGGFKTYMAPNASQTTFTRRNALGITVGWYLDNANHFHGLVFSGSSVATVDYPNANPDTEITGINYWGTIVGFDFTNGHSYGNFAFKLKNGKFTRISYPGSSSTYVSSISDKGVILGSYLDSQGLEHGFILESGVYTTVDNPKADPLQGQSLADINSSGMIVGGYYDSNGIAHSFIYINGLLKDIVPPNGFYTIVGGINGYGYVTGVTAL